MSRWYSDEPFEPDRAGTPFAHTEIVVIHAGKGQLQRRYISPRLAEQRAHLRPLERDRRTFWIVFVIGVRQFSGADDVVELATQRHRLFLSSRQFGKDRGSDLSSFDIREPVDWWHPPCVHPHRTRRVAARRIVRPALEHVGGTEREIQAIRDVHHPAAGFLERFLTVGEHPR